MARKGPLPRLLPINAPHVATDFKPLSPRSGEKSSSVLDCTRRREAALLYRHMTRWRMLAGVANSGNAVIGLYPRRSWLFVAPISLLDICTASLRVLSWACLGAWFFFVTKPRWQIIQSRLSMPCRCRELSKIYAGRSRSVRGRFPDSSNDRGHQHRRQQRNY